MKKLFVLLFMLSSASCFSQDFILSDNVILKPETAISRENTLFQKSEFVDTEKSFWGCESCIAIYTDIKTNKKRVALQLQSNGYWKNLDHDEIKGCIEICDYMIQNVMNSTAEKNTKYIYSGLGFFQLKMLRASKKEWKFGVCLDDRFENSWIYNDGNDVATFKEFLISADKQMYNLEK